MIQCSSDVLSCIYLGGNILMDLLKIFSDAFENVWGVRNKKKKTTRCLYIHCQKNLCIVLRVVQCFGIKPYINLFLVLVLKKSRPGFHSAADLHYGVSLLPSGGRPIFQLFFIPQTGKSYSIKVDSSFIV